MKLSATQKRILCRAVGLHGERVLHLSGYDRTMIVLKRLGFATWSSNIGRKYGKAHWYITDHGVAHGRVTMLGSYENRRHTVTVHAWKVWTKNGLGLCEEMHEETLKTVKDAVANVYQDEFTDAEWLVAALLALGR